MLVPSWPLGGQNHSIPDHFCVYLSGVNSDNAPWSGVGQGSGRDRIGFSGQIVTLYLVCYDCVHHWPLTFYKDLS